MAYETNSTSMVTPCRPTSGSPAEKSLASARIWSWVASITLSLSALLASTADWTRGTAKLISIAASRTRGSMTRRTNWVRVVTRPHIIRKAAHVTTAVSAESDAIWTSGVKLRIGPTVVKAESGATGLVVREMNDR